MLRDKGFRSHSALWTRVASALRRSRRDSRSAPSISAATSSTIRAPVSYSPIWPRPWIRRARPTARRGDAGLPHSRQASVAKLIATDAAMNVTTDAVQVFGGYGYTQDFPAERYARGQGDADLRGQPIRSNVWSSPAGSPDNGHGGTPPAEAQPSLSNPPVNSGRPGPMTKGRERCCGY